MNPDQQDAGGVMNLSYSDTFNPDVAEHQYIFSKQYDANAPTFSYVDVVKHDTHTFNAEFRMAVQTGGAMQGRLTIDQP